MGDNQNINVNVTVQGAPPVVIRKQPGCLLQFVWFIFIGWWLGGIAVTAAYFLFATVIGIPLGVMIINKIPYLMALRSTDPVISYGAAEVPQRNIVIRILWFFFFGFWFTGVWLAVAYIFAILIITMPIAFWMFDKAPTLLTLRREG